MTGGSGRERLILWLGVGEYEEFHGTVDAAVRYIKQECRYSNYGRTGALLMRAWPVYRIEVKPVEQFL